MVTASYTEGGGVGGRCCGWLDPSQVCYCYTDSVMFIYDETNPKHKSPEKHKATNLEFGKGLGLRWREGDATDYLFNE